MDFSHGLLGSAGSVLDEEVDEFGETSVGREGEGGFVLFVAGVDGGSALDEEAAYGDVAFDGGEHQERPAVLVSEVRVEAGVEGGAEAGFVAAFDEVLSASVGHCGAPVGLWSRVHGSAVGYSARCWGFLPKSGPK